MTEWQARKALNTGISYRSALVGAVSEFEEREAALFNGYTWKSWREADYSDRVDGVAHFRLHHLLELIRAEVESDAVEARAKAR